MKDSVTQAVHQAFVMVKFPENFNNTLLVLIPKIAISKNFSHFHSISLCTVIYKIIIKVLAYRMKEVLSKLIGEGQTSFVPNCNITDNIVIAQEVVNTMRKKSMEKTMAIKIDLHKVYNRLWWEFIEDTLREASFPETVLN